MEALCIGTIILHVGHDGLFQETTGYQLAKLLFAEVAGINATGTLEKTDVNDVVVINIVNAHSIIIVGR